MLGGVAGAGRLHVCEPCGTAMRQAGDLDQRAAADAVVDHIPVWREEIALAVSGGRGAAGFPGVATGLGGDAGAGGRPGCLGPVVGAPTAAGVAAPRRFLAAIGRGVTGGVNHSEDATVAAREALLNMINLLMERGYSREQAYCICSVAVDLKISELVDVPNFVVSAFLPLDIFTS